ncbi:septum site-determining protein Ssd [Marinactinospora rubrisoli]|uniref:Septum site-determining protein Ssd n=1 Tax=Marinactinospora rubrisoli TaxID=2715399 RepID=A0ABW2KA48_9ACTN
MDTTHAPPAAPARPLLVTADSRLLDDLLRLAAAADVEVTVAHAAAHARRDWDRAPLVVAGADLVPALARLDPDRHPNVVVVEAATATGHPDDTAEDLDRLWPSALRVGAREVLALPEAETRLVDLLAEAADGGPSGAALVAVVGGRGGAGASLVAIALALAGQRHGARTLLVDADPLGGGLDLLLGHEHAEGARWAEFLARRGRMSWQALRGALPSVRGFTLLTWSHGTAADIPAAAMRAVLASAARGSGLVVADLPRALGPSAEEALRRSTVALVVLPADVHAVVAASRLVPVVREHAADVRLVVRCGRGRLAADVVAATLDLPVAGELIDEPGLARALERGDVPAGRAGSPLAAFGSAFVAELCGTAGARR